MKYLIIGASGMVGHLVAKYLEEQGNKVTGYSRRKAPIGNSVQGDVYDSELLDTLLKDKFDIVVNAAGLLVADCEARKDRAVFINGYLPHFLAEKTEQYGGRVFQLSTDCVFKGNTGPYTEDSFPDGIEFYSKAKAIGELNDNRNLTLRNSVVGPDINEEGIGLLNWFMKQTGEVDGWEKAIWTGMTTLELAKVIEYAAAHDATGLINMVPDEPAICKKDLLTLFNKHIRGNSVDIIPSNWFDSDKTLVRTNHELDWDVASYEQMVIDMAKWIEDHRDLYPPYYYQDK